MRTIGKILVYTVGIAVVGCLLAPPLYWAGRWGVDLIPQLESVKFPRYFNRSMMVVTLASLWPFLRWLGIRRWSDLGLEPNPTRWRDLGIGFVVAALGLWLIAAGLVLAGHSSIHDPFRWHKLPAIVGTTVAVPIIEEVFFRGALFGVLRQRLRWPLALAFLSFFFAVTHFLKPPPGLNRMFAEVHWGSGFELLPHLFWQFGVPTLLVGKWLTLFVVGWILGYTVVKTRSLFLAIGLHGGWVFALRSFDQLSRRHGESSIWVGHDLTTGLLPVALLLVTWAVVVWLLRNRTATEGEAT
jgi:membrane protease YdiL (CAAX protease family)